MQDRPSSCSTSSSWPHPSPISPPRRIAEMQSCHRASSECIEEMSYSGVGVGAGDEESSRDISRSQVRIYCHFFFITIIILIIFLIIFVLSLSLSASSSSYFCFSLLSCQSCDHFCPLRSFMTNAHPQVIDPFCSSFSQAFM
jgi:hypothetical protein